MEKGASNDQESTAPGPLSNLLSGTPEAVGTSGLEARRNDSAVARTDAITDGLRRLYDLRGKWSPYLMILLAVTTVFQGAFIVLVGRGVLDYKEYQVFVNTVAGQLFLQIAGMGYIVVRCLFPSGEIKGHEDAEKENKGSGKTDAAP